MTSAKHEILARQKAYQAERATPEHFTLGPAFPIDELDLVEDPCWSLYCLDPSRSRALFLRLPPELDLTDQPFVYMAQFDHATDAAFLSIDRFIDLSGRLPKPRKLVHLFSTGRCGSTLASKVFSRLDGVWSISEPDAVSPLAANREAYGKSESIAILAAVTRWTYKPQMNAGTHICLLKYRSEALFHAADFLAATPDAIALFQYRTLPEWCSSIYRFAQKLGVDVGPGPIEHWMRLWTALSAGAPLSQATGLFDVTAPAIEPEAILCALWVMRIEAFREFALAGHPLQTFSYEDLTRASDTTVSKLLDFIGYDFEGLPGAARKEFEIDSQVGTAGAQKIPSNPLGSDAQDWLVQAMSTNERVRLAIRYLETLSQT